MYSKAYALSSPFINKSKGMLEKNNKSILCATTRNAGIQTAFETIKRYKDSCSDLLQRSHYLLLLVVCSFWIFVHRYMRSAASQFIHWVKFLKNANKHELIACKDMLISNKLFTGNNLFFKRIGHQFSFKCATCRRVTVFVTNFLSDFRQSKQVHTIKMLSEKTLPIPIGLL